LGWKWAPIGGLQYRTHMQAPKYDVQFLRSEGLHSSSSSSSRTRQIKECYIDNKCVSRTDTNPPFAFDIAFSRAQVSRGVYREYTDG